MLSTPESWCASGLGMLCRLLFSLDADLTCATPKCEGASIGVLSGLISLQVSTYWDSPERLACPKSRALFCNRVSEKVSDSESLTLRTIKYRVCLQSACFEVLEGSFGVTGVLQHIFTPLFVCFPVPDPEMGEGHLPSQAINGIVPPSLFPFPASSILEVKKQKMKLSVV